MYWADVDGDTLIDAWAVLADGSGHLLLNNGDGSFLDVTEAVGLGRVQGAHMAAWCDVDGDGLIDVYMPSAAGPSRLFLQGENTTFSDVSAASGLPEYASALDASWFDFDNDGRPDLHLVTATGEQLHRNVGGGMFEHVSLGIAPRSRSVRGAVREPAKAEEVRGEGDESIDVERSRGAGGPVGSGGEGRGPVSSREPVDPFSTSPEELFAQCGAQQIMDQSNPMNCIQASTDATLGLLYPLSTDLNVDGSGNVGIGTTSPATKLDVAGNVRADRLQSTVNGVAPLVVNSSTRVNNLNSDLLDGMNASDFREVADPIQLSDMALNSVNSARVVNDSLTAADIAPDAIGTSELGPNAVANANIVNGTIINADVSPTAAIDGEKIDPDFGDQDIRTTGSVTFDTFGQRPWSLKADGDVTPTRGYLAVQGNDNFDGLLTMDINNMEIGAIGAALDLNSPSDNLGVLGHSNGVGVRGQHSGSPDTDYAELGTSGIGIVASGSTLAGQFEGDVDVNGVLRVQRPSAQRHLTVLRSNVGENINSFVNIERGDTNSANDMIQIQIGAGGSSNSQFIEAQRANDIEFRVDGDVFSDGTYTGPADFAEMIAVSTGARTVKAGDVLVIDPLGDRSVRRSAEPYSRLVAGVYSTNPGFIGSEREWDAALPGSTERKPLKRADMAKLYEEVPVAIVGIVPCKVSAENGPIRPGDLLVTSSIPGHAMVDNAPPVGTVVGKALGSLGSGAGTIRILVTLQ